MSNETKTRQWIMARKVLWIIIWWGIFSIGIGLYEFGMFYQHDCLPPKFEFGGFVLVQLIAGVLAGIFGGTFLVYFVDNWFRTKPYGEVLLRFIVAYTILSLFIVFVANGIMRSLTQEASFFDAEVWLSVGDFVTSIDYLRVYTVWLLISLITVIALLVNDKYGPGVFRAFLLGNYFRPKREERIFMFLDMRSSTEIAEKLGEAAYFNLLKDLFRDITSAIQFSKGEIYQYVGDEIVINWKAGSDTDNANCLHCFFDVQKVLIDKAPAYLKTYGLVPQFKAGLHAGYVMVGEIGVIKRDIAFSGDVLNTTSRIQDMCNETGVNLLFSESLLGMLNLTTAGYLPKSVGNLNLRGKAESMLLYTI